MYSIRKRLNYSILASLVLVLLAAAAYPSAEAKQAEERLRNIGKCTFGFEK